MKVELSNDEIKDIYHNLAGIVTHEALVLDKLEKSNNIQPLKEYADIKEDTSRRLELIIKLSKLIDW